MVLANQENGIPDWEKIFTMYILTNEFYLEYIKRTCNTITQLNNGKNLNMYFTNKNVWMVNIHTKICSTPLVIRKMQNKTTMSYHCTLLK